MAVYGSEPSDLVEYLQLSSTENRDWSVDILIGLSIAYAALERLEEQNRGITYLGDKQLVISGIKKAWREALYIRSSLPSENLEQDIERPFRITRFGSVKKDEEDSRNNAGKWSVDRDNVVGEAYKGNNKRRGSRQFTKRIRRGEH